MFKKKMKNEDDMLIDENTYSDYDENILNNTNHQNNSYDSNSFANFNDESNTKSVTDFYNEQDLKNITHELVNKNLLIKKIMNFILIILGLIIVGCITYSIIDVKFSNHDIKLNLTSIGLIKNRTTTGNYQMDYLITPKTSRIPRFNITNKEIIKINEMTSYITALKTGETEVEVFEINGNRNIKNTLKVYVVDHEIKLENFIVTDMKIKKNVPDMITITPYPENATELNYIYQSNNPEIVEVNNEGIVTGLNEGSAQITITNNKISRTITISVS